MRIADIIKRQTTVITLVVITIVAITIGVSYAIFFDVKEGGEQVIKAGTLEVTLSGAENGEVSSISIENPKATSDGLTSAPITYTPRNNGTLPASYKIYIYAKEDNTVDLNNVKFSIDGNSEAGESAHNLNENIEVLQIDNKSVTVYKIDEGLLNNGNGNTRYLRLWIDEDTIPDSFEEGKISLNLYVYSVVDEESAS